MNQTINEFINTFSEIKKMGYVKSVNNYSSGIGLTFEKLLGKETDDFSIADYNGIELKTKSIKSKTPINLFKLTPEGKDFFETKRLFNEYGYYLFESENKVLYGNLYANKMNRIGKNYFILQINYEKRQIEIHIYNKEKQLIENESYWPFSKLENVLLRKLYYLAFIKASSKLINNERYFYYNNLKMYKLTSFKTFLKLIEEKKIYISFSIDSFKSGKRKGQFHDHGTGFCIKERYLDELFNIIKY